LVSVGNSGGRAQSPIFRKSFFMIEQAANFCPVFQYSRVRTSIVILRAFLYFDSHRWCACCARKNLPKLLGLLDLVRYPPVFAVVRMEDCLL
jgi:hypothetical protein